jgi:hypothetical protein
MARSAARSRARKRAASASRVVLPISAGDRSSLASAPASAISVKTPTAMTTPIGIAKVRAGVASAFGV